MDCGDGHTGYEYTKNHETAHFKWMNYMVCEWYLNNAVKKKQVHPGPSRRKLLWRK